MVEKINGKVTISRVHSSIDQENWIELELHDEKFKTMLNAKIELKEFAKAVTGQGHQDCLIRLFSVKKKEE